MRTPEEIARGLCTLSKRHHKANEAFLGCLKCRAVAAAIRSARIEAQAECGCTFCLDKIAWHGPKEEK